MYYPFKSCHQFLLSLYSTQYLIVFLVFIEANCQDLVTHASLWRHNVYQGVAKEAAVTLVCRRTIYSGWLIRVNFLNDFLLLHTKSAYMCTLWHHDIIEIDTSIFGQWRYRAADVSPHPSGYGWIASSRVRPVWPHSCNMLSPVFVLKLLTWTKTIEPKNAKNWWLIGSLNGLLYTYVSIRLGCP